MTKFNTPILLVAWRRPNHLKKVIEAVRKVEPTKIFVAVDGARLGAEYSEERKLIEETKQVIEKEIDWECELMINYQEQNLGCEKGVSTAISWFFQNVSEGIILEDDCVPNISFFRFCAEMLDKYRNEDKVMTITGNNFNQLNVFTNEKYYFSRYNHIWGWATWSRAWKNYNFDFQNWLDLKANSFLDNYLNSKLEANYWSKYFDEIYIDKTLDTWDYPWRLNIWQKGGLTVTPVVNLVENIGFDDLATHSKVGSTPKTVELCWPLKHPSNIKRNIKADNYTFRFHIAVNYFKKHSFKGRLLRKIFSLLRLK